MVGLAENKANSAQLELEAGAELGKNLLGSRNLSVSVVGVSGTGASPDNYGWGQRLWPRMASYI